MAANFPGLFKKAFQVNRELVKTYLKFGDLRGKARYGSIHHVDHSTILKMYRDYRPVFILSTGRAGTKFIERLVKDLPMIAAFHEPEPILQYFCDYVFHNQKKSEVICQMFQAARMEYILHEYINNKVYLESNQCMTFFAPQIAKLFPKSKFIALYRHPGDFAVSAIKKGWYVNDSIWEAGRIKLENREQWNSMSLIEKQAWLWASTYGFIRKFSETITEDRFLNIRAEDLFSEPNKVTKLLEFIDAGTLTEACISEKQKYKINELLVHAAEPANIRKNIEFPGYGEWSDEERLSLKKYTEELALLNGYEL